MTATDPGGLTATQSFTATVPNRSPEARGEVPAATIEAGDSVHAGHVSVLQRSGWGQPCLFGGDIGTWRRRGRGCRNTITLTALARGTADITVTATDPGGLTATQSFTATVPNRSPEARGEVPAATIEAGDSVMLDMSPYFSDPDGDSLAYSAATSEHGVAAVAAAGNTINLTALARGTADITVTATDPGGLSATQSFTATVSNRSPEARGEVPAATIEAGDSVMLDMSPYFSDPDGTALPIRRRHRNLASPRSRLPETRSP